MVKGRENLVSLLSILLFIIFFTISILEVNNARADDFNCSVSSDCDGSSFIVLRMENETGGYYNAHAEWWNETNYQYYLCCNATATLNHDCGTSVLKLSGQTNAHVQIGNYSGLGSIYSYGVCMSAEGFYIGCYYPLGSCSEDFECIASIASSESADNNETNSHIGPCSQYDKKVCCRISSAPTIVFVTPPTPANNSRNIVNYANITANITAASASIDTCTLEWNNGSVYNLTMTKIGSGESILCELNMTTIDGTRYWYKVYANTTAGGSNVSEYRTFLENTKPTAPTLTGPSNGNETVNHTTIRMPLFNWTAASDADGDSLNYTWNTTCWNSGGGSCSPIDGRYVEDIEDLEYTPTTVLKNFWDTSEYYNWSVRAWDGFEYGPESSVWKLYIDSLVSISTINSTSDFGSMNPGTTNDTVDNSPYPISIQNDGNCYNNVSIYSTQLWASTPSTNESYRYKFDYLEQNSFNWTESVKSWANVPIALTIDDVLSKFGYTDTNDSAELDVNLTPIGYEPSGSKSATVTLTGFFEDVAE